MQALTVYSFPRYFPMVLAFAGDSTMTKYCFAIVTSVVSRPAGGGYSASVTSRVYRLPLC